MYIKNIQLTNFRNYDVLETEFHKNVNLILGNNAQGKTNLLEAVYITSIGRSFRTNKDSDLVRFDADFAKVKVSAEKEIFELVGHEFNIASTKQLQKVLFTERGLPHGKKTKLGYSTDTSVLEELAEIDPVPKKILEYRELAKLLSPHIILSAIYFS